jgi:hypothetical protein
MLKAAQQPFSTRCTQVLHTKGRFGMSGNYHAEIFYDYQKSGAINDVSYQDYLEARVFIYKLDSERRSKIVEGVQNQTHNSSSPKLLSVGNCDGCNRWRKGKRWGLQCTVCVRNDERIVDNYAQ